MVTAATLVSVALCAGAAVGFPRIRKVSVDVESQVLSGSRTACSAVSAHERQLTAVVVLIPTSVMPKVLTASLATTVSHAPRVARGSLDEEVGYAGSGTV